MTRGKVKTKKTRVILFNHVFYLVFPSCKGPEEVLWEIFSFLDLEDLFSCEAVCVAWRSSFNERIWTNALRKTV
jgi:F-box-like